MSNPLPTSKFEIFLIFMLVFCGAVIDIATYPFRKIKSLFKKKEE